MFSISSDSGIIVANRGDSFSFPLFINMGTPIVPIRYSLLDNPTSEVYIGVCEPNQRFEDAIIKKKYTASDTFNFNSYGDLIISFTTTDTENLIAGLYYYEVKLRIVTNAAELAVDADITIASTLLTGSKLASGSKIDGVEVVIPDGEAYYTLQSNKTLVINDIVTASSTLVTGSTLNGISVGTEENVNTLVPKTKFIIEE